MNPFKSGVKSRNDSRIADVFARLGKDGRKALIPYFLAGFPTLEVSGRLIEAAAHAGADVIEVGIPYSDPLADGVSIQKASQHALEQDVDTDQILDMLSQVTPKLDAPIVIMTYYNIIFRYGLAQFAEAGARAGVAGVIIPDLPPEESGAWLEQARAKDIDTIFLVAPTSSPERVQAVTQASEGFVYCVSLAGVTGARTAVSADLSNFLAAVRRQTDKPLAVGFGISTPEQAAEVAKVADGVIIGSALINLIDPAKAPEEYLKAASDFLKDVHARLVSS